MQHFLKMGQHFSVLSGRAEISPSTPFKAKKISKIMNMEILVFWTKPLKTFSVNKYKFSTEEESIHTSEL